TVEQGGLAPMLIDHLGRKAWPMQHPNWAHNSSNRQTLKFELPGPTQESRLAYRQAVPAGKRFVNCTAPGVMNPVDSCFKFVWLFNRNWQSTAGYADLCVPTNISADQVDVSGNGVKPS